MEGFGKVSGRGGCLILGFGFNTRRLTSLGYFTPSQKRFLQRFLSLLVFRDGRSVISDAKRVMSDGVSVMSDVKSVMRDGHFGDPIFLSPPFF